MNALLQRAFGSDIKDEPDTSRSSIAYVSDGIQHSSAIPPRSLDLPWLNSLLPISSSSQTPISSLDSQTFGNNMDELNSDFAISNPFAHCGFKEDCTSRPTWRNYMAKSTVTNRQKSSSPRESTKETENVGFSLPHAVFKRKQLRLPVPAFMKGDVS